MKSFILSESNLKKKHSYENSNGAPIEGGKKKTAK